MASTSPPSSSSSSSSSSDAATTTTATTSSSPERPSSGGSASGNSGGTAKTMDVIRDCSPTRPKLVKTSDRHARSLLDAFSSLRRTGELCDVVLVVGSAGGGGGGTRIRAHKIILSAASPYFKAMFTNEFMAESRQSEIVIHDVDENAMEMLIDFCYSARITIDEKIVQSLLPAACLLQLQEVQDFCAEFLKSQLDPSNCLGIRAFADTHSCRELLKIADKYLQNNFTDVVESDEFMLLPVSQLVEIVSNDELNVRCEEQVYEAVMKWLRYDLDERRAHLAQLMSHVRFPLLDIKYLVTRVGTDPLIRHDQACRDLVDEAKDFHLLPGGALPTKTTPTTTTPMSVSGGATIGLQHQAHPMVLVAARYKPRKPVITGEVLFAVGGWCSGDAIASVEMFNPDGKNGSEWRIVASMSKRRCGVGVGVLNNQIYAIGGHDGSTYLNNTERYDPTLNQWFSDVAPTASCRTSVGVAVMDGLLYAVGGQDGVSCLNVVDRYDPATNRWSHVASMNSKRLGVAVVVLGSHMYAVGGSDGNAPLNTVERYEAKTNRWSFVAPMLTRRKHLGCAVYKSYIYAVGGRDDAIELNSAERYDTATNQWQPVVSMKSRRSGVGLAVVNGTLMAIGGFDGSTYLKTCEIYDPDANVWKLSGSMIYRRLGGGVGVVKMTKENNIASNDAQVQNSSITNNKTPVMNQQSVHYQRQVAPLPYIASATTASTTTTNQMTTPTTVANNSWPFILSPVPSILANVTSSSSSNSHHSHSHTNSPSPFPPPHHNLISSASSTRPIQQVPPHHHHHHPHQHHNHHQHQHQQQQSPPNSNNTISIATITTPDSIMNDLRMSQLSSLNAATTVTTSSEPTPMTSGVATNSNNQTISSSSASSIKLVDV